MFHRSHIHFHLRFEVGRRSANGLMRVKDSQKNTHRHWYFCFKYLNFSSTFCIFYPPRRISTFAHNCAQSDQKTVNSIGINSPWMIIFQPILGGGGLIQGCGLI